MNKYMCGVYANDCDKAVYAEDVSTAAENFAQHAVMTGVDWSRPRDVFVIGEGMVNRVTLSMVMRPTFNLKEMVTLECDGVPTGAR
jgi:hypothetical protein